MNSSPLCRLMKLPPPAAVIQVLALPLRLAPTALQRRVLTPLLNRALQQPLHDGDLDFLNDRVVEICISDLGQRWPLTLRNDRFELLDAGATADVTISGNAWEYVLLSTRRVDPDTLFFQRRLAIEGDTELGLAVKNTLDAVDEEQLPRPLQLLLRAVGDLIHTLDSKTVQPHA